MITRHAQFAIPVAALITLFACSSPTPRAPERSSTALSEQVAGRALTLADTELVREFEAAGVAEPLRQATLSTKLMATVTSVLVREGDTVRSGQTLVQLDARELHAKTAQVAASVADAEAMQKEAATNAARFAALYADSAATRAQFDASQTGLARADAALRAARAAAGEVDAVASYSTLRAPFAGVITSRQVDPGAFAAPGAPMVTVQDISALRITASISADANRHLTRGQRIRAQIDGDTTSATVEGVVPSASGGVFTVNAIVPNGRGRFHAGSSATVYVPTGTARAIVVPTAAIVREGDLTGVIVRAGANGTVHDERRWVRLGATRGGQVEITSGVRAGDVVVVPAVATSSTSGR